MANYATPLTHLALSQAAAAHLHRTFNKYQLYELEFGAECRELFTIPEGYQLVGVDLSGIELRCLAHFMQDGGAYAKEILDGDIHSANAAAMGVSRDEAKLPYIA